MEERFFAAFRLFLFVSRDLRIDFISSLLSPGGCPVSNFVDVVRRCLVVRWPGSRREWGRAFVTVSPLQRTTANATSRPSQSRTVRVSGDYAPIPKPPIGWDGSWPSPRSIVS